MFSGIICDLPVGCGVMPWAQTVCVDTARNRPCCIRSARRGQDLITLWLDVAGSWICAGTYAVNQVHACYASMLCCQISHFLQPQVLLQEEKNAQELLDVEDKPDFTPQAFDSLRQVPMYSDFIKERFERCLDLYLCPRGKKNRINVDPQSLVPKLPKPQDLQPFPTTLLLRYTGHKGRVRPSYNQQCSASVSVSMQLYIGMPSIMVYNSSTPDSGTILATCSVCSSTASLLCMSCPLQGLIHLLTAQCNAAQLQHMQWLL